MCSAEPNAYAPAAPAAAPTPRRRIARRLSSGMRAIIAKGVSTIAANTASSTFTSWSGSASFSARVATTRRIKKTPAMTDNMTSLRIWRPGSGSCRASRLPTWRSIASRTISTARGLDTDRSMIRNGSSGSASGSVRATSATAASCASDSESAAITVGGANDDLDGLGEQLLL